MPGIECWCERCELVTQHYGGACSVCAALRAAAVTVPIGRVGRERAQSRADVATPARKSRAVTIVIECVAIGVAIVTFAL